MSQEQIITRAGLKTPKAAAVAGIAFSLLMMAIIALLRASIPPNPLEPGAWLSANSKPVTLALNLMPIAGVSFLWFIGVLRDRLGPHEDRFFETVFLGSALLFLAMMFVSAAIIGALLAVFAARPDEMLDSLNLYIARALAYNITNVYAVKMACVFMISTSTVTMRTGMAPRWIALLGFVLALILLFGSYYISWSILVLPLWVLLLSIYILIDNFRRPAATVARGAGGGS